MYCFFYLIADKGSFRNCKMVKNNREMMVFMNGDDYCSWVGIWLKNLQGKIQDYYDDTGFSPLLRSMVGRRTPR